MARPKKATVDYFPHLTAQGSTLFILQNRWGNDGYSAWFKILERIGCSNGLYIDCRHSGTWRFLQAYTCVSEAVLIDIIDTLADLDAIDKSLWSNKVIYCQHFVDNVSEAFKKRLNSLPTRAGTFIACELTPFNSEEFLPEETPSEVQIVPEIEQTDAGSTDRERDRDKNTLSVFAKESLSFFEELWSAYPKDGRVKKKEAMRHYLASVKTSEDMDNINNALGAYINHLEDNEWKKPQNGSTWFNNWQDWEVTDAQ